MAKKKIANLDFTFFTFLKMFYDSNKKNIRKNYKLLTKKFLDFNDTDNTKAFLRRPQFEALEMYVFLKEFLDNKSVYEIFDKWYKKQEKFANRDVFNGVNKGGQLDIFDVITIPQYEETFKYMKDNANSYPNYIFALTMGVGKTILMATCIFYEFILANKYPKDEKYCHNALVFAPDKTVLQSLKEIMTMDKKLVVAEEYANWLAANVKFHFLDESGGTLNTIDKSKFNIIISNTQKIILKKQHTEKSSTDKLMGVEQMKFEHNSVYGELMDFYEDADIENEADLMTNQRFMKLTRLEQLGVYVDEAHHLFGRKLEKDMENSSSKTSLRTTINLLAESLKKSGTNVVACFNYTGTPYAGNNVLPEVVYAYGIKEAIDKNYLKQVAINGYTNVKSNDFLKLSIEDFWQNYGDNTYEGMKPKMAIFASNITELESEVKPQVEEVLLSLGISLDTILVNVGDNKLTSNDDIREFNNLDTVKSNKQFILLVNKGKEGWNCRSLFSVALYRKPDSKVFVLQATMRCLRAIGPIQEKARVYLSQENMEILEEQLQENFKIGVSAISNLGHEKSKRYIRVIKPIVKIPIKRIRHKYELLDKNISDKLNLGLEELGLEKYQSKHIEKEGLKDISDGVENIIDDKIENRSYSELTLVGEVARYINRSCLEMDKIINESVDGIDNILKYTNKYNEILYDIVIPKIFEYIYEIKIEKIEEKIEMQLVKEPKEGYYEFNSEDDMTIQYMDKDIAKYKDKSFHVDTYCFDSKPEVKLYKELLYSGNVEKVYFTGMLTGGQSDFYIQYIDPESKTVRSYYPDFLVKDTNGKYRIIEVKGDNMIDNEVVIAKADSARELTSANDMIYELIKSSEIMSGKLKNSEVDQIHLI